jgi:hypothetical protein
MSAAKKKKTKTVPRDQRTAEHRRLAEDRDGKNVWKRWGPYVSDRQWGTVREDYSPGGDAWEYFPHDHARMRAYRWGEDGIAGISDDNQLIVLALALWNGKDPILKERFFGLTNKQGNHGEDVKELYYYLDATPTHSYLRMLYKYPQTEFPYARLLEENNRRGLEQPEYELLDTGIFDEDRYFDVVVEYAKADPDDILMRITAHNRGPDEAQIHLLPQIWFRNTWSWFRDPIKPNLKMGSRGEIFLHHQAAGDYRLYAEGEHTSLFCDNETNPRRLYGMNDAKGYFKDAFHDYLIHDDQNAVNPEQTGTKAMLHHQISLPGGASVAKRLRLTKSEPDDPFADFDAIFNARIKEADEFYGDLQKELDDEDARNVQRQALAGMIWNKQFYYYNVKEWLDGDPGEPAPPEERTKGRNKDWIHLLNSDIISMPDTWEYPWYAAWDLAFHCIPLSLIDPDFAKKQLLLISSEWYQHPNGQLPAYEWEFSDVNPPVHAWASWRVFQIDRKQKGDAGDLDFLERVFHKLLLNFTWWVNRKDAQGRNIFQGGFLGMDNIGVFDRNSELPSGGYINQSDGTSWMAMYCLNMMRIALELAQHDAVYEDIATKFFEHFLYIADAMTNIAGKEIGLWNEEDQFYYDVLYVPKRGDGGDEEIPIRLRSMVGLIPLFAVETLEPELLKKVPNFHDRLEWTLQNRPELAGLVSRWTEPGRGERRLLSLLRGHRMKMTLRRMLDESEFLSDYGIRALSKVYEEKPYIFSSGGQTVTVAYHPGESETKFFGGNSNWRGPIWFPVNYLIIESLQKFHHYYTDDFKIECPTGSGKYITIEEVSEELTRRLSRIFLRDKDGKRAVFGQSEKMQNDPNYKDYILFYEYFHGDIGRGVGASHQTGWTGLIAKLLQPRRREGQ